MMIDRYLIRYFLAVIDQGNFSRAASHCNVSQPTLSIGIAKLEKALGIALFVRSNQRVELTEAGARFQIHARRIEQEFNRALQTMRAASDRQSLRIGILGSIASDVVALAIDAAGGSHDIQIELTFGTERDLTTKLAKQRIDLALTIVGRGQDRFSETPIASEGYRLAISSRHRMADRMEIAAEDLADEAMIVRRGCEVLSETSRHFLDRGVRPRFAMRAANDELVMKMVGAGLGLTVMPTSHRALDVVRPFLIGFAHRRTLGWVALPDTKHFISQPPPIVEALSQETIRVMSD